MILTNPKLGISAQCRVSYPYNPYPIKNHPKLLLICSQVRIHIKVISCVQHSSNSLDYGSVDQLLPLLDDGLLVGQVPKKGSTRRQVSVLSSWVEAWNILHSDCAQTALELVKYQHIICQLFAPDGNLEVCKALLAGHSYAQAAYLGWEVLKEDMLVW